MLDIFDTDSFDIESLAVLFNKFFSGRECLFETTLIDQPVDMIDLVTWPGNHEVFRADNEIHLVSGSARRHQEVIVTAIEVIVAQTQGIRRYFFSLSRDDAQLWPICSFTPLLHRVLRRFVAEDVWSDMRQHEESIVALVRANARYHTVDPEDRGDLDCERDPSSHRCRPWSLSYASDLDIVRPCYQ